MTSRNRNRQAPLKDDADEERSLWKDLVSDGKKIDGMLTMHNQKWARMTEIKETLESQYSSGQAVDPELEDELLKLSRENIKLLETISSLLQGTSEDETNSILGSLNILKALRQSSEHDTSYSAPPPRAAATASAKASGRNPKRKAAAPANDTSSVLSTEDRDSIAADSPSATGPSPKVMVPSSSRLKGASAPSGSSRAGSAASTVAAAAAAAREASVKIEEGSVDSSGEGGSLLSSAMLSKPPTGTESKSKYTRGAEVFYRYNRKPTQRDRSMEKDDQGEGILCTITNVIGDGKTRKYEILDVEPDDGASPYRASLTQMVAIPTSNEGLLDPAPKRMVLAMYPGTTTFYRADVVAIRGKDLHPGYVRLRFEDEDEKNKELEVERRYVLLDWPGK